MQRSRTAIGQNITPSGGIILCLPGEWPTGRHKSSASIEVPCSNLRKCVCCHRSSAQRSIIGPEEIRLIKRCSLPGLGPDHA
ncbi:MAG TPA: hypothetical protein DCY53_07550 [Desulfobacteraceae bacterium]|nr:hypothetical protein [Desulfobacteraceae bacterium]